MLNFINIYKPKTSEYSSIAINCLVIQKILSQPIDPHTLHLIYHSEMYTFQCSWNLINKNKDKNQFTILPTKIDEDQDENNKVAVWENIGNSINYDSINIETMNYEW